MENLDHSGILRSNLIIPEKMRALPVDPKRGYVVPRFVHWVDGKPEFRIMDRQFFLEACSKRLCWICGQQMNANANNPFLVGPMCTVNRLSSEPPSHVECARYAAQVCPFLTMPKMERRRDPEFKKITNAPPGVMLLRNPGVCALWFARDYEVIHMDKGTLFRMGSPAGVEWYTQGGPASRAQAYEALQSGVGELLRLAAEDSPEEVAIMATKIERSRKFLPSK